MRKLVREWVDLTNAIKAVENRLKELKERQAVLKEKLIKEVFKGEPGVYNLNSSDFPGLALQYQIVESHRLDTEKFKHDFPDIYARYQKSFTYDKIILVQTGDARSVKVRI
ncbi:MAG: hypothetical protein KatS3mg087_0028 [Patescibacteria group bacterium]|nr:MAG: hypothetical protein KatS3mg087_0028 [Patescibacteria group bacterium]